MKKKFFVGASLVSMSLLLSACGSSMSDVKPLSLEEVAGKRLAQMSADEKEGLIYKYVSDRITVDKKNLISLESKELSKIDELLDSVNSDLVKGQSEALKPDYANYLLLEFARTPYKWKQASVNPVGFDPASRLYFVDVTYKTSSKYKKVVPISRIPNGSPDEEKLKKQRYTDYMAYLAVKQGSGSGSYSKKDFEGSWGNIDVIKKEQQGIPLLERTAQEGNKQGDLGALTYTGLVKDTQLTTGATMTFRYIFKYNTNLGEESDMQVSSVYLKDYNLDNSKTLFNDIKTENISGVEVLKPFVDKLILSHNKSIEESNHKGLYTIHQNFGDIDKYYDDLGKYAYNSIGGYNFEILDRTGTSVNVKVKRINKIRAKGADMSLPTYDEEWLYRLVLDKDDKIKISSANLVDSKLVGEPISVIKNVSGISDLIKYSGESFTDSNEKAVKESIKKFSNVVFDAKVDTPEFTKVVDIGVSQPVLKKISDVVQAVPDAERKLTYIVSWNTKTNVYVSLTLREVFEKGSQSLDTESTIDLINRDGKWRVVNYNRNMNIKTNGVKINSKNALVENKR